MKKYKAMNLKNTNAAKATAKALKNASSLINDENGNLRFLKFMETINKISQKGNHTFVLSDFVNNMKN